MEFAILAANEFVALAPKAIELGLSIWNLGKQVQANLQSNAAPDNPAWVQADKDVADLMARALDPATDDK